MKSPPTPELVLLIRGGADHPQDLLGGRTPLDYAELPGLRALSRRGRPHPFNVAPSGHAGHGGGDLFAAFGVTAEPGEDLPVAAVTWHGTGETAGIMAIHADPVRMAVSYEATVVMDPDELALTRDEAEALVATLNEQLFAGTGAYLAVVSPGRWVLHLEARPDIRTVPLEGWIGADASGGLPEGPQRGEWHRLINEAQMVLAAHPVNEDRRREGRSEVNSLWFWGGGALPAAGSPGWQAVWGEAPELTGLARLTGVPERGPVTDFGEMVAEAAGDGPILAVADTPRVAGARGDLGAKVDALEDLDREWLGPLEAALASRQLAAAWVILGPEAPTGTRAAEPVPAAPALACRGGRVWPWSRPKPVNESLAAGRTVGWADLLGDGP
ncbi:hypothetical protein [Thiohalorhabdus sp.]|uniref:hypothetical protein n=1 Tax=Thiohalorhabdus sp. TaxID=3094134 RepID=UPI002FC2E4C5